MSDDVKMLKDQIQDLMDRVTQAEGQVRTANEMRDLHIRATGMFSAELADAKKLLVAANHALKSASAIILEAKGTKNLHRQQTIDTIQDFLDRTTDKPLSEIIAVSFTVRSNETDELSDPVPAMMTRTRRIGGEIDYALVDPINIILPPTWKGMKSSLLLHDVTGALLAVTPCSGDTGPGVVINLE